MERLTTREEHPHGAEGVSKDKLTGRYCRGVFEATACVEKLAEYENDEEDGLLVRLPCKAGDILYKPTRNLISKYKVVFIEISVCNNVFLHTNVIEGINDEGEVFGSDSIGETVFLTEEAAQEWLKEIQNENRSN